jgi:hypothetical protein
MRPLIPVGDRFAVIFALSFFSGIGLLSVPSPVAARAQYIVQPVAEMKVKQLPKGELFWRVESFPTLDEAKAAAPPYRWNPDTVSYDGLPSLTAALSVRRAGQRLAERRSRRLGLFHLSARPSTCYA